MATYDFRILLETVEGVKTSYMSQSFVDTSTDLILSASQVYSRITGSVSCSYQNNLNFSGSDFNTNKKFSDNLLLSSSLTGSLDTGSIEFTALNSEYDRLLRYKFIGEQVCNVLGLPNSQWIYVDQFQLNADNEANIFQGNIDVDNIFINDTLTFANNSKLNSDVPFLIDTGSNRHIKFIDQRGSSTLGLIIGYDKNLDTYEISGSTDLNFNIGGVDNLIFSDGTSQTTAGGGGGGTPGGSDTQVQFNDGGSFGGESVFQYNKSTDILTAPTVSVTDDLLVSQDIIHALDPDTKIRFSTDKVAISAGGGDVTNFEPGGINTAGHITASGNISGSLTSTGSLGHINVIGTGSFAGVEATTANIGDITIDGSIISSSGNTNIHSTGHMTLDSIGDLTIDSTGGNIYMTQDDTVGNSFFRFRLDDTPELDVVGDFILDGTGGITIDSATEVVSLIGNVTASGDISASGTITGNSLVGTLTGTSTGLAGTPDITVGSITATSINTTNITSSIVTASVIYSSGSNIFGDEASDTHTFNGHITASGNISSSITSTLSVGTGSFANNVTIGGGLDVDGVSNLDYTNMVGDVTIEPRNHFQVYQWGGTVLVDPPALMTIQGDLDVRYHITASGDISASGDIVGETLYAEAARLIQHAGGALQSSQDFMVSGDITASGIISASGNIYAEDAQFGSDSAKID